MKKVFIKTFGCSSNYADSEVIGGILSEKGFKLVNDFEEADIVVVNSCGVKSTTQNRVISFVRGVRGKKVYVGGCLPRMLDLRTVLDNVNGFFDNNTVSKVGDLIFWNEKEIFSNEKEDRILMPVLRKNKDVGIINIAQGCLGNCNYCSVKFARGNLKSYRSKEIVEAVEKALEEGCKEIRLSSQDNGCYGKDIDSNLVELLKEVVKIKGDFEIRVGMMNPEHVLGFLDELVEIFKDKKIKKFLHVPVESGSDEVLKDMNRAYKVEDFLKIVRIFRKEIPEIHIATDVICGFPTESEKSFEKTVSLIREIKPEVLNISKFGARPGTKAIKLEQLPSQEVKRRSKELTKIFKSLN